MSQFLIEVDENAIKEQISGIKSFEIASDDSAKQFWNRRADNV